jgi:hypothetical membrane protein
MAGRRTVVVISGFACIAVYLSFTVAARAFYPTSFDPAGNWLSDLGNPSLNPSGAVLYRLGCILTGLLLVSFFVALGFLRAGRPKRVSIYTAIAQALGAVSGLALVLTGIFSEGNHSSHSFWSAVLYISFGTAVFFVGLAFVFMPGFSRSLSYLAFAITACDWVMAAFNTTRFLEWIVVTLMLVFVAALAVRLSRSPARRSRAA